MRRLFQSAFVIARRDFTATVLSKTFIFFLLGPLLPLLIGGLFGGIGGRVANQTTRPLVAVVDADPRFVQVSFARNNLAEAIGEQQVVQLIHIPPLQHYGPADPERILKEPGTSVRAVLYGSLAHPRLAGNFAADDPVARQMRLIVSNAQAPEQESARLELVRTAGAPSGNLAGSRALTAQGGQFILFFLSLLLATMLLSQVIEEKSNKIIEVIAAAVPMEAMFLGKLFAMLAASLVGIVVWASVGALLISSVATQGLAALPQPAVGWPTFLTLTAAYFATNYLILGALFLSIGAQASTAREVQTLSMPVTILQVMVFAFAMSAIGRHDETVALAGAAFPLSSPLVMLARAAELPDLWPHVLGLLWQLLWVALMLKAGARFFRSRVLKSGPSRGLFRRSAKV